MIAISFATEFRRRWLTRPALLALALVLIAGQSPAATELQVNLPALPSLPPATTVGARGLPHQAKLTRALRDERLTEARKLAQTSLQLTREAFGPEHPKTAAAQANLGIVKQAMGDHVQAVATLKKAIGDLEEAGDRHDPRLQAPWYALGLAYLHSGQARGAIEAMGSALHLRRINAGLFASGQDKVLDALARAHHLMGATPIADEYQLRRLQLIERSAGIVDPAFDEAITALAQWFAFTNRPGDERRVYAYAVERLGRVMDTKHPRFIAPLLGAARSFRQSPQADVSAKIDLPAYDIFPDQALRHAKRIVEQHPEASLAQKVAVMEESGNFAFTNGRRGSAAQMWANAIALLPADSAQAQRIASPELLSFRPPKLSNDDAAATHSIFVLAEFTVTEFGRVEDIRILEAGPGEGARVQAAKTKLRRALKFARVRPRLVSGELKPAPAVRLRFSFAASG